MKGAFKEAEVQLAKALQIDATCEDAFERLAGVLYVQGKLDSAMEVLAYAIEQSAEHLPLHQLMGEVHVTRNKHREAAAFFKHAAEISPDGDNVDELLSGLDGVLVAPGFGERGIEGKIKAVEYARLHKKPFFGICLGLQLAVIEFARNVCGLKNATSYEFNPNDPCAVITVMEDQKSITNKGGTMRLGGYDCVLRPGTRAYSAYQKEVVSERHRHRYEVNNEFRKELESKGLVISGVYRSPKAELVEMIELADHPWFVACQFHPEFKSKPLKPHPLFAAFVSASLKRT